MLIKGNDYSLTEILSAVGGGERQSYLPQRGGTILCGLFVRSMNPEAPYAILTGDLPKVRRKAELVSKQKGPIPVFTKDGSREMPWRYHGEMICKLFDTNTETLEEKARQAGRKDKLAGILRFKDA
jgi:hypothetical protein